MDKISKAKRRANMKKIKSKNTKPEIFVRKILYSLGYRYRIHSKELPGKPDIVFIGKKKVIFVHGCFWHQHDDPNCNKTHIPKTRIEYWEEKLKKNVDRDKKHLELLEKIGWACLVVWECQLADQNSLIKKLKNFLDD